MFIPSETTEIAASAVQMVATDHQLYCHHQYTCARKYYEANFQRQLPARDVDRGA